ncbi:hypothetical protein E2C01_055012 [Portunus trituberculatus]|uniref:Uncharacterized protein n=1 Tax=Portunus trituberculatus TaxID=210409 RepID=A0A5B7GL67_PORTR|nr:hypothetical protein [Portunus trituberculatus]
MNNMTTKLNQLVNVIQCDILGVPRTIAPLLSFITKYVRSGNTETQQVLQMNLTCRQEGSQPASDLCCSDRAMYMVG